MANIIKTINIANALAIFHDEYCQHDPQKSLAILAMLAIFNMDKLLRNFQKIINILLNINGYHLMFKEVQNG